MAVNSTSSSNWASMFGITSKGIGGLVSGLNTDELVQALTTSTRSKIAKQQQSKQLLNWKMSSYRTVITAMQAYQTKNFKSSTTNIMSAGFFSTFKSTSNSAKITASAGASAVMGEIKIDSIQQLASAQVLKGKTLTVNDLASTKNFDTATFDPGAFTDETIKISFGNVTETIELDELNGTINDDGTLDTAAFEKKLQALIDDKFDTKNVYLNNAALSSHGLDAADQAAIKAAGDDGWTDPTSGKLYKFNANKGEDGQFYEVQSNVDITLKNGELKFDSTGGRIITESSSEVLGLQAGKANRLVPTSTSLASMDEQIDGINLQGADLKFSINGVEISVSRNDTISSMMNKVNSSNAGVRMSYDTNTGQFKLDAKTSGGGEKIVIRDVQGNLMNQLFGAQGGNAVGSASLTLEKGLVASSSFAEAEAELAEKRKAGQATNLNYNMFDLTINGVTKQVRLDDSAFEVKNPDGTSQDPPVYSLVAAINQGIKNAFGINPGVEVKAEGGIAYIETADGTAVSFGKGGGAGILGFNEGDNNYLTDVNYSGSVTSTAASFTNADDEFDLTGVSGGFKLNIDGTEINVEDVDLSVLSGTFKSTQALSDAIAAVEKNINDQIVNALKETGMSQTEAESKAKFKIVTDNTLVPADATSTINNEDYATYTDTNTNKKYYEKLDADGELTGEIYSYDSATGTTTLLTEDEVEAMTLVRDKMNVAQVDGFTVTLSTDPTAKVSVSAADGADADEQADNDAFLANFGFASGANNDSKNTGITLGDLGVGNSQSVENGYKLYQYKADDDSDVTIYEKDGKYYTASDGVTEATMTDEQKAALTAVTEELDGVLTFNGIDDASTDAVDVLEITYNSDTNLRELIDEINTKSGGKLEAKLVDGKLSIEGANGSISVTDSGNMLENVFGLSNLPAVTGLPPNTYVTSAADSDYDSRVIKGKNLEVVVNGQTLSYNSNSFTIDGVTLTANQLTTPEEEAAGGITINTVSDATDTMDRIKSWIEEYNALVFTLNSAVNETRPKNNGSLYDPLTDEQKADMSESEIEKWEIEAKKGMLYNDSTIRSILTEMRQALYEKVEAAGLSLYDLGLQVKNTTVANEHGQLEFMPTSYSTAGLSGEDKLRQLLESEPDRVRSFFQDPTNGLGTRLNSIFDKAVKESSVDRGSLITIAGTEANTGNNTSQLGTKMSAIDELITNLKTRLENEYNRYWKQFSALEVAVSKMNSQSSWLTQQQ